MTPSSDTTRPSAATNHDPSSWPDPEPVTWQPTYLDTVRYSAAMFEFQRLHWDPQWAVREGLDVPIVQGPLLGTKLSQFIESWAREHGGRLVGIRWRNRSKVDIGTPLTLSGRVTGPTTSGSSDAAVMLLITSDEGEHVSGTATVTTNRVTP